MLRDVGTDVLGAFPRRLKPPVADRHDDVRAEGRTLHAEAYALHAEVRWRGLPECIPVREQRRPLIGLFSLACPGVCGFVGWETP